MSVKKEPSGRRSVQVEVEVPGTPEQVWQAIATGPGISSWFMPCQVDGRVGGSIACDFGSGMVSGAKITVWEPPHRLVAEDSTWLQGGPPVATEWIVEARGGGKCVVRVVHSLYASTDQWDDQIESTETGWPSFFHVLRYYLQHHAGERSATAHAVAFTTGTPEEAWNRLAGALGLADARAGQRLRVQPPGTAALAGSIEQLERSPQGVGLRAWLAEPAPGAALIGAYNCMGMLMVSLQLYYYGERAEAAARDQARWQEWLGATFPAPQPA
ncbi:MAG: SRPBCC domain-containing protein [Planctomycetota bacterium]|nr:MAG: SRPBCC domain-containing protein [Planctomycetota bacterium]